MVTAVTNLGRSGLSDWLVQRFSAIILGFYTVFIIVYLLLNPNLSFEQWSSLFDQLWMRVFTLLVIVSCAAHGWIGLWGVLTDYVTDRLMGPKATIVRILTLMIYAVVALTFVIWGVEILWGF